jgi:membrane protein CcdC involved in cytochrome C biogenesis
MKLSILLVITLLLAGCLGPELFTLGGIKVTAGTAITVPHKIEAYEKYKKEKKEYKAEEHKKSFEVNKVNERTFEIYY